MRHEKNVNRLFIPHFDKNYLEYIRRAVTLSQNVTEFP